MWLRIPYSGLGCMGNFEEPIVLENLIHTLVWWLLGLGSGLRDYLLLHLWFLAVCNGRRVLLYVVVLIIIIVISVTIVTIIVIVTKTVVG